MHKGKELLPIHFKTLKYSPQKLLILCKKLHIFINLAVQIHHDDYILTERALSRLIRKKRLQTWT